MPYHILTSINEDYNVASKELAAEVYKRQFPIITELPLGGISVVFNNPNYILSQAMVDKNVSRGGSRKKKKTFKK